MNCQNCSEPIEAGAAFCGNCGQQVQQAPAVAAPAAVAPVAPVAAVPPQPVPQPTPTTPTTPTVAPNQIAQVYANQSTVAPTPTQFGNPVATAAGPAGVPSYALPNATAHNSEVKVVLSVVLGALGILGALIMPLLGLALGIASIILSTLSHRSAKHGMRITGLVMGILAVIAALAMWTYIIASHDNKIAAKTSSDNALNGTHSVAAEVSTPCYSVDFSTKFSINNTSGTCDMSAYDGATLNDSTEVYKVYADSTSAVTSANFEAVSKKAIEYDLQKTLPSFTITKETVGKFAGSPAYLVTASNTTSGISVVEAAVMHAGPSDKNFFVFAHIKHGNTADLKTLESGWDWE